VRKGCWDLTGKLRLLRKNDVGAMFMLPQQLRPLSSTCGIDEASARRARRSVPRRTPGRASDGT